MYADQLREVAAALDEMMAQHEFEPDERLQVDGTILEAFFRKNGYCVDYNLKVMHDSGSRPALSIGNSTEIELRVTLHEDKKPRTFYKRTAKSNQGAAGLVRRLVPEISAELAKLP